jgi:hypothetical protein
VTHPTIELSSSLVVVLSYLGGDVVEMYAVIGRMTQSMDLPPNINCINSSEPELYPLNTREAFLLHCTTSDGKILYIVPLSENHILEDAVYGIQAEGAPYSSLGSFSS